MVDTNGWKQALRVVAQSILRSPDHPKTSHSPSKYTIRHPAPVPLARRNPGLVVCNHPNDSKCEATTHGS